MKIFYFPNEYSQQRQREKKRWIYPVLMAMEAEWYRRQGHDVVWYKKFEDYVEGTHSDKAIVAPEGLPFLELPSPDRSFTQAMDRRYQGNGNFKYHPGTYIQVANGCWHGRCTFCVENGKPYEVRPVNDVINEIDECKALGFKEIFDDSGTFPTGGWLDELLRKLDGSIKLGCNMRVVDIDYKLLKDRGFRMVLFGLESANQKTLDKIGKGVNADEIIPTIKKAARAGLSPHIAVMFGYPWETEDDAVKSLQLVHYLLRKGYAKTAQASFYSPQGIGGNEVHRKYVKGIYNAALYPGFWLNKLRDIHDINDLRYLWRMIKEGMGSCLRK